MHKTHVIALAALVALAVTPALAADNEGGFFIGIEAKFIQPSNLDSGYVLVDPDDDFTPEGNIASTEFSNEFSPAIHIGQAYGNGAGWALGYWSFDDDARDRRMSPSGGNLWDIIFHADEAIEEYEGTADAFNEVEADSIELVYWRQVAKTDNFHLTWAGGLRVASFENMLDINYDEDFDADGTVDTHEDILFESEGEGYGITTGLRGVVRLGENWKAYMGASISKLMGEVEGRNLSVQDGTTENDVFREEDRSLTILELELGIVVEIADNWHIKFGYEAAEWSDFLTRDVFPDDVNEGFIANTNTDVNWDGYSFGVGVMF